MTLQLESLEDVVIGDMQRGVYVPMADGQPSGRVEGQVDLLGATHTRCEWGARDRRLWGGGRGESAHVRRALRPWGDAPAVRVCRDRDLVRSTSPSSGCSRDTSTQQHTMTNCAVRQCYVLCVTPVRFDESYSVPNYNTMNV